MSTVLNPDAFRRLFESKINLLISLSAGEFVKKFERIKSRLLRAFDDMQNKIVDMIRTIRLYRRSSLHSKNVGMAAGCQKHPAVFSQSFISFCKNAGSSERLMTCHEMETPTFSSDEYVIMFQCCERHQFYLETKLNVVIWWTIAKFDDKGNKWYLNIIGKD